MKEKNDQEIDLFLSKAIKELEYEEVPLDFTSKVLAKIEKSKVESASIVYRPLISKTAWLAIGLILILVFSVLGFYGNFSSKDWLFSLKWNTVGNINFLNSLPKFDFFDSTVYGFIGFTIFIFIQIVYLKRYFSKRNVII